MQDNYTGPPLCAAALCSPPLSLIRDCSAALARDGERCASTARSLPLLLMARTALWLPVLPDATTSTTSSSSSSVSLLHACWWLWRARLAARHRELLGRLSASLLQEEGRCLDCALAAPLPPLLAALLNIEKARWLAAQDRVREARALMQTVREQMGFSVALTGRMGRRTKYQTFDVAQLVLQVERDDVEADEVNAAALPEDGSSGLLEETAKAKQVALDEDNPLLEKVRLTDGQKELDSMKLASAAQQAAVLTESLMALRDGARDDHSGHLALPFVVAVMELHRDWTLFTAALYCRSHLELLHNKTRDRAVLQLDVLQQQWGDGDGISSSDAAVMKRFRWFWSVPFPARHALRLETAKAFLSIGAAATAADMFRALGRTHELVKCLVVTGRVEEAEKHVLDLLANEGASNDATAAVADKYELLCLLADLREDESLLHRAWEESGQKCSMAMRALARKAQARGDHEHCVEYYANALRVNACFPESQFSMGCSLIQLKRYEEAAAAFAAAVHAFQDDGQAWANLSSALRMCGRMEECLIAAQQAARHSNRDWRVWSNLLQLGVEMKRPAVTANALRQLLQLQGSSLQLSLHSSALLSLHSCEEWRTHTTVYAALLDDLIATLPQEQMPYALRADVRFAAGDFANGLLDCGRHARLCAAVLQRDPTDASSWKLYARCYADYALKVAQHAPADAKPLAMTISNTLQSCPFHQSHPDTAALVSALEKLKNV